MMDKAQVFTPKNVVEKLLDEAGYIDDIFEKTILENSCGDGNVLVEIVERYIKSGIKLLKNSNEIKNGLEKKIVGVELDRKQYIKCLKRLNDKASEFGIFNVNWNIFNSDYLQLEMMGKFDFIVGNPPYISYKDLDVVTRNNLKKNFKSCSEGKFDYCYAFIEKSIRDLNSKGILSYLIPNSIFKNVFGKELRKLILPNLKKIIDLRRLSIFDNVLTSTAILVCDRTENRGCFIYIDEVKNESRTLEKTLLGDKWIFEKNRAYSKKMRKLGDYFLIGTSIATQLNKAYLLADSEVDSIESDLVRLATSPRSMMNNKQEYIIFPYYFKDGNLVRYSETEFMSLFPRGYRHLEMFKPSLQRRKAEKNVQWFEYGRTQAIANMNQEKLLTSFIVTNRVKTYFLSREMIPYSGIYVTTKGKMSLKDARKILESKEFFDYVCSIGIPASGNSIRITANDIKNYKF